VPAGYEMISSNFNPTDKKLIIQYKFVTNDKKTLVYSQKELGTDFDASATIKSYIDSRKGISYTSKTDANITYTEFSDGTLIWTKDKFVFTIEANNYDYSHDQIYQMAKSLG
jgi:hypothetical protein